VKLNLYLASKNRKKVIEIRKIVKEIAGEKIKILLPPKNIIFPEETGKTFEENAYLKAKYLKGYLKEEIVIGEDSGLIVDKLNGLPGVNSARFAGIHGDDKKNIKKLLEMMRKYKNKEERKAKFITVVCLLLKEEKKFFKGEVEGFITFSPRGKNGFGYDPIFEFPSLSKTFAELSPEEKNKVSHRAIAFRKLSEYLETSEFCVMCNGKSLVKPVMLR